jgi:hypothetical protein
MRVRGSFGDTYIVGRIILKRILHAELDCGDMKWLDSADDRIQ